MHIGRVGCVMWDSYCASQRYKLEETRLSMSGCKAEIGSESWEAKAMRRCSQGELHVFR